MSVDTERDTRDKVIKAWGEQRHPKVLAPTYQMALSWLVENDELLTRDQGSYQHMIVTKESLERLRGWRGMLVILRPMRYPLNDDWHKALSLASSMTGVSLWTETLP